MDNQTETSPDQNLNKLSNKQLAALMGTFLEKGCAFRFRASGESMSPFIKNGDILTICSTDIKGVTIGDAVAFLHPENLHLTVHRVISRKGDNFLIKADNSFQNDGWVNIKNVEGIIQSIEREGDKKTFGFGQEKRLFAALSRYNILYPIVKYLRYHLNKL